ncbi:MAG: hypothetical protein P4L55_09820 [Syntrophobacteraceae bacterium]|nr:hypothetical protein [Syntrophobacteraceae bacterium]
MRAETNKWPGRAIITSIFVVLLLFAISVCATAQQAETSDNQLPSADNGGIYNDYAHLIAGIPDSQSALASLQSRPAWVEYSKFFHRSWMNLDKRLLVPERSWSQKELGDAASSERAVFYPFSGPDFANVNAFFPKANTYVLVALEPLGDIPGLTDMTDGQFGSYLQSMKNSLHDLLNVNYFLSAHMDAQIEETKIKGVLPILLLMLARDNAQVLEVRYLTMGRNGEVRVFPARGTTVQEVPAIETTDMTMKDVEGIRIIFKAADSEAKPQTLYYFYVNLCNSAFDSNRYFLNFLRRLGPFTTFMKSASYVMFDPETSSARQFMLDNSRYIVQEDSGIPLKYFDSSDWSLRFYGHYVKPISTFKEAYQEELASVYKTDKKIKPLPFGFGYFYNPGKANLMFAARKSKKPTKDEDPFNNPDYKHFFNDNALFHGRDQNS